MLFELIIKLLWLPFFFYFTFDVVVNWKCLLLIKVALYILEHGILKDILFVLRHFLSLRLFETHIMSTFCRYIAEFSGSSTSYPRSITILILVNWQASLPTTVRKIKKPSLKLYWLTFDVLMYNGCQSNDNVKPFG